jgi:hypothetical protein
MSHQPVTVIVLLGGSYPRDLHIEEHLSSLLPYDVVRYSDYLLRYQQGTHIDRIDPRIATLQRALAEHGASNCIVIGRSSGAIVATRTAVYHAPDLLGVVALGYPFRHPQRPQEPYRTEHLPLLRCPTLILQGDRDEYGDAAHGASYPMATGVSVESIAAAHDVFLSPERWAAVADRLERFIEVCRHRSASVGPADAELSGLLG